MRAASEGLRAARGQEQTAADPGGDARGGAAPGAWHRVAGHFGEWLQGCLGQGGPVALVTVACPVLGVSARHRAAAALHLAQTAPPVISEARLRRFLVALGHPPAGRFELRADMPPGGGAGASTAALVALGRALGAPDADLPAACLRAEGASDPLMLPVPDAVLWAPRAARMLAPFPVPPRAAILGGFRGPPLRTDPRDTAFPDISDLVTGWQGALAARDLPALAALASESARRTTALRGPGDDPLPGLARELGALGHLRAHTGSAGGLIFAPGTVPPMAAGILRRAGFTDVLSFETGAA